MHIRLLGTAAGGGFPQWNCNCDVCRVAREDPGRAKPRTQSCVAVSGDGKRWFLVNASPDLRSQVESFPALRPPTGTRRGSGIAGVLLTNADLDHTLGLLLLREGERLSVHATGRIRGALTTGLNLDALLDQYCGIDWREPPAETAPLTDSLGHESGLLYCAFGVPGKPPRYLPGARPAAGDAVGYRFVDPSSGGRLVILPDLAAMDPPVQRQLEDCDLLLLDGTFHDDDEMLRRGVGTATAAQMGHLPIGGPGGSLHRIAALRNLRRVYVHVNNTNPILIEDSPQRKAVESAGVAVGADGMEFDL